VSLVPAKNAVLKWASDEISAVQWRFANQNSPSFSLSRYPNGIGTIQLISVVQNGPGRVDSVYDEIIDKFIDTYIGRKRLRFSVNLFGPNSYDNAEKLKNSVLFDGIIQQFERDGLGFITTSEARNITALVSAQFEERAQFDISFYTNLEYVKTFDRIAQITVQGKIEDGDTIDFEETFNFEVN
jgi:hypothetical protein